LCSHYARIMAATRDLTPKQRRYVEAILAGNSKSAAYRLAYGPTNCSAKTVGRNAQRTSKSSVVRAEIDRRTLLTLPQASDSPALWQHGIAVLLELTEGGTDSVRLKSALALIEAADAAQPFSFIRAVPTRSGLSKSYERCTGRRRPWRGDM